MGERSEEIAGELGFLAPIAAVSRVSPSMRLRGVCGEEARRLLASVTSASLPHVAMSPEKSALLGGSISLNSMSRLACSLVPATVAPPLTMA